MPKPTIGIVVEHSWHPSVSGQAYRVQFVEKVITGVRKLSVLEQRERIRTDATTHFLRPSKRRTEPVWGIQGWFSEDELTVLDGV